MGLVQISVKSLSKVRANIFMEEDIPAMSVHVPEWHSKLTGAISEFWYKLESKELCGTCVRGGLVLDVWDFKGVRHTKGVSGGCCGGCVLLSFVGCTKKPIGCAIWACEKTFQLIPEGLRDRFQTLQRKTEHVIRPSYRASGLMREVGNAGIEMWAGALTEEWRKLTALVDGPSELGNVLHRWRK